jgi:hypothetical protein
MQENKQIERRTWLKLKAMTIAAVIADKSLVLSIQTSRKKLRSIFGLQSKD